VPHETALRKRDDRFDAETSVTPAVMPEVHDAATDILDGITLPGEEHR
jgi:hypothetical protein